MNIDWLCKWGVIVWTAVLAVVYGWHLLALTKYHWLTDNQLDQIRVILTFLILGWIAHKWIQAVKGEY